MSAETIVRRIAIVGPECTGKTELSKALALHYQTAWVPEFARDYINRLDRPYVKEDLLQIAQGQVNSENEFARNVNRFLFCDTNLVVIKIWSEFKYGDCDPEIISMMANQEYDLHLLTYIDIPWEDDPQREHPDKRQQLYNLYKAELIVMKANFIEIKGERKERLEKSIHEIDRIPGL